MLRGICGENGNKYVHKCRQGYCQLGKNDESNVESMIIGPAAFLTE